jgi:HK97 family phage prohead protease
MKTKDFALHVKDVAEDGLFEGYASVFGGEPDSYGDIVMPGAFALSLAKHKSEGTMPLMLWNHKSTELPIGVWIDMVEDGHGLLAKGQVDLDDPIGSRVHRAMKRNGLRGLSIGYETVAVKTDPKMPGVEFLETVDLWEVSPVNFPAKRDALITDVKSVRAEDFARRLRSGEPPTIKEFEDVLGDLGVPKALRTAIASHGYAKAIRSESEGAPPADVLLALRAAAASFR